MVVATMLASGSFGMELRAQDAATAGIQGTVRALDDREVDGSLVTVIRVATGYTAHVTVRHGRFLVSGLEVGGPYVITVRGPGFAPEELTGVRLALGERYQADFVLRPIRTLEPIVTEAPSTRVSPREGTSTIVTSELLHRLPTLNRNLYDFVVLAPQISTKVGLSAGGLSGGGAGFRFNNFLIDGVPQRSVGGNVPPEFAGSRSVPLEAVDEYQILLAPFDARYGQFTGATINAVTRSGTNQFRGSAFGYWRSDALARRDDALTGWYDRLQYGFSFGGPIKRDRMHFFVAAELQDFESLAPGPYLGASSSVNAAPVASADIARLDAILRRYGLVAGSGGPVTNRNPLASLFGRADANIPSWRSRLTVSVTDGSSRIRNFTRPATGVFPLSTNAATQTSRTHAGTLRLHTQLSRAGGGHNELFVSHRSARLVVDGAVRQPIISVSVPRTTGGTVSLVSGTPELAQGSLLRDRSFEIGNELTIPLASSHVATVGIGMEQFRGVRGGALNAYGSWTFASLDSLDGGLASSFVVNRSFTDATVPINGRHYTAHLGDRWQVSGDFSLTFGVRGEVLTIDERAPYDSAIAALFGRRTDERHAPPVALSPRLGFAWDLSRPGDRRLRGGIGVFTVRPPVAWFHAALYNYGVGVGTLRCGQLPSDHGPPPPFVPDYRTPPLECADGSGVTAAPRGVVNLVDPNLAMARSLRAVLAYDHRLTSDLIGTIEAVVTRNVSDFVFVNRNLVGAQGADRFGRVLYGSIAPTGIASPLLRSGFAEVIDLRNTGRNHAMQGSLRLERRFVTGGLASAHYTYSRVRDVQTPLRIHTPASLNWSSRAVSGRHDDLEPEVSLNDIPHRVVLAMTTRAPWRRWTTELSMYYVGESGGPFTYRAWGATRGRGDLNADGSSVNDPIYVPRHAADTVEMRFAPLVRTIPSSGGGGVDTVTVAEQAAAFDRLIEQVPCLRRQRGRIIERNSCRDPWTHVTAASVRQRLPIGSQALEAQVDFYNLLRLFGTRWGRYRVADPALLEHVGQTAAPLAQTQPIFRFDPAAPRWTTLPDESAFQLQFALRYRF